MSGTSNAEAEVAAMELSAELELLREMPVWKLTADDIDKFSPHEQVLIREHVGYLKSSGALLAILTNPPGTKFEVAWNGDAGQWTLKPLPSKELF